MSLFFDRAGLIAELRTSNLSSAIPAIFWEGGQFLSNVVWKIN